MGIGGLFGVVIGVICVLYGFSVAIGAASGRARFHGQMQRHHRSAKWSSRFTIVKLVFLCAIALSVIGGVTYITSQLSNSRNTNESGSTSEEVATPEQNPESPKRTLDFDRQPRNTASYIAPQTEIPTSTVTPMENTTPKFISTPGENLGAEQLTYTIWFGEGDPSLVLAVPLGTKAVQYDFSRERVKVLTLRYYENSMGRMTFVLSELPEGAVIGFDDEKLGRRYIFTRPKTPIKSGTVDHLMGTVNAAVYDLPHKNEKQ